MVDLLDAQFNLINNTHGPYRKPNDIFLYININSNHPPSIKKQIPKSIGRRISNIYSSKTVFENNVKIYEDTLRPIDFDESLQYIDEQQNDSNAEEKRKGKRKRKNHLFHEY